MSSNRYKGPPRLGAVVPTIDNSEHLNLLAIDETGLAQIPQQHLFGNLIDQVLELTKAVETLSKVVDVQSAELAALKNVKPYIRILTNIEDLTKLESAQIGIFGSNLYYKDVASNTLIKI